MARPLRMAIADGWYHMFGRGVDWNGGRSSVKGEAWEQFADRRGDEGRDLFLWAARRFCGMSLSEFGKAVGANFAAVSMATDPYG